MTEAFLIGSRVYGTPREDSDIDLVVRMDPETAAALCIASGVGVMAPLRFGPLNIIYAVTDEQYESWRLGLIDVLALKTRLGRPVTREEARDIFESYRAIHANGKSGPVEHDVVPANDDGVFF